MLQIYNTLTKEKEIFSPIKKGKINMYVCGMTTYDYCHMGHGRLMVCFDMVARVLRFLGYDLRYVRNITDVDDKIIKRANDTGSDYQKFVEQYIEAMHEDERALETLPPNLEPRATEFIPEIIQLIQRLIDNGMAYVGSSGDVYYDVRKFEPYGQLSRRDLDKLRAGERIAVADDKKDPLDFVLWKKAKPSEPSWVSPWGEGRPGWHIECSCMSMSCLGETFDIHGGGVDLLFPHHENEIAQSEGATHQHFVNTWMHMGHLQINQEKMSKSLGNFFTIRDVLKHFSGEVIRYFILASHYRSPLNYSEEALQQAEQSLQRLYFVLRDVPPSVVPEHSDFESRFVDALSDDFNTPEAFAVLFYLAHEINRLRDTEEAMAKQLSALLKKLAGVLGFLQQQPNEFLQQGESISTEEIESLIAKRQLARDEKNWKKSDEIRDQLLAMGVVLEDQSGKTMWRLKTKR